MSVWDARKIMRVFVLVCLCHAICGKEVKKPIDLTEENWRVMLEGEWMVEFMAPWCPACRSFEETWNSFSKWGDDLNFSLGVVDVTENPGLSGRFFVTALPTIYHVRDGVFRQYVGSRKEDDLVSFVDEKKWQDVDPVSAWIHPNSIQMSTVGLFFKAAMVIRSFYTMMTEEYGIPEWGCYVIFAVVTIITGLILGLLVVCCCDFLFPPKHIPVVVPRQPVSTDESYKDKDDESDILDDTKQSEKSEEDTSTTRKRRPQKTE